MNLDRIKDKLRKLLNLSDSNNASQGEIDNAMNAATRLMSQHNLTRDDIDLSADDPVKNMKIGRHSSVSLGRNFSTWEGSLLNFVSTFIGFTNNYRSPSVALKKNGLAILDEDGKQRYGSMVYFYGSEDNAEAAVEIYEELRDTTQALGLLLYGGWFRGDGAVYCQGFIRGLVDALDRSMKKLKEFDDQTTALVLVDEKNQLAVTVKAKAWLHKQFGVRLQTKARRGGARGDPSAYRQGRQDGANYNPSRPTPTRKLA
jgi:hypothetical protein